VSEGALEDRVGIGDIDSLAVYKDTAGEVEVMCLGQTCPAWDRVARRQGATGVHRPSSRILWPPSWPDTGRPNGSGMKWKKCHGVPPRGEMSLPPGWNRLL